MKKLAILSPAQINWSADNWSIDSFTWGQLAQIPHLSDYDYVILDLSQIPTKIDWTFLFSEKLTMQTFFDVAAHGGRFVIIGDPRIKVSWQTPANYHYSNQDFLWWTGLLFHWNTTKGDSIVLPPGPDKFHSYISKLKKYSYTLDSVSLHNDELQKVLANNKTNAQASVKQVSLATNRANKCLAAHMSWLLKHQVNQGNMARSAIPDTEVGPLTILPDIGLGSYEMLEIVLRDCLNVPIGKIEPNWATDIVAPNQELIDVKMTDLESKLVSLQNEHSTLLHQRASIREYLKLLYSQGSDFEIIVRKVLAELGASVEEPAEVNKEDGWITTVIANKKYEGVLEIKGTEKNSFNEQGIRQLNEWKSRGIMNRKKKYKGIFIGNSTIDEPPDSRPDPFSRSFIESSELSEHVIITSLQLYGIYDLHCRGKLDHEQFWQSVFDSNGILDLSKPKLEKPPLVVSFAPNTVAINTQC